MLVTNYTELIGAQRSVEYAEKSEYIPIYCNERHRLFKRSYVISIFSIILLFCICMPFSQHIVIFYFFNKFLVLNRRTIKTNH